MVTINTFNRRPDGGFESLDVSGTTTTDALEATGTLTDPSGVDHTEELADKADVGEVGFPYDITDVQDVPDNHSVIVEGPVDARGGTLDDKNARVKIE